MSDTTDRTLIVLFIIIAILALIVYFVPRFGYYRPVATTVWHTSAPASAGTVVRAISPVSSSRSTSYYSTDTSSTYTRTIPGNSTTTTYYNSY